MTLKPSNLLNLCDDIQWKIGKEIKYKRIEKDAKKRKEFLNMCLVPYSYIVEGSVKVVVRLYNTRLDIEFENEIHAKIKEVISCTRTNPFANNPRRNAEIMGIFYNQIKVRIQFYYICDLVKCRNYYQACVDSYDPNDFNSDSDFDYDSDEDE